MHLLPSQEFALNQFLLYHPTTAQFDEILTMVRRSAIQVKVKPQFQFGSVADMIEEAERNVASVISLTNGTNERRAPKSPGRTM